MSKELAYYKPEDIINTEMYSSIQTEVKVELDMFHEIWPNLSPKKELADQIARACGVSFSNALRWEDVHGDVSIVDGVEIKKKSGLRCTMQGYKMDIDGTMQMSPPLSYEFNWESRAEEDFLNDELSIGTKDYKGKEYKPKYYIKGDEHKTDLLRRKHIAELKRFPTQRASTGASLTVIKYLTGIPSGFKEKDLKDAGMVLKFSRVIRSEFLQGQIEKAKVKNIMDGGLLAESINDVAGLLTGKAVDSSEDFNNHFERVEQENDSEPENKNKIAPEQSEEKPEFTPDPYEEKNPLIKEYKQLLIDRKVPKTGNNSAEYFNSVLESSGWPDNGLEWAIDTIKKNYK